MRRTPPSPWRGVTAAALAVSACGREDAGSGAATTGKAVASGAATGTITVWAMGAEGDKLPDAHQGVRGRQPRRQGAVTAIPWDAAHDKFTTAITAEQDP